MATAGQRPGRWKPGESGNPLGASRRQRERALFTAALRAAATPEAVAAVVASLFARAQDGDNKAAEIILDRIDGPVPRDVLVSGSLTLADAAAAIAEGCQPEGDE